MYISVSACHVLKWPMWTMRPSSLEAWASRLDFTWCHSASADTIRVFDIHVSQEMKRQGATKARLQLLDNVSGSFRPGVLTALVGVSGAGKTTLMDVLAGRKTGGYIEGDIYIAGFPKVQSTFARISGYCEQNDIHSPQVTIYESLTYSAWLRLPRHVKRKVKKVTSMFRLFSSYTSA